MADEDHEAIRAFEAAVAVGPLSTVLTQLRRIARSRWPGYEITWNPDVQEDYLSDRAMLGNPPIFDIAHVGSIIGDVRRPPQAPEDRYALLWCLVHCLHLRPDDWPLTVAIPSRVLPLIPTSQSRFQLGRILITAEDRDKFMRSVALNLIAPRREDSRSRFRAGVYEHVEVEQICGVMLERATPYVGPGGKLLVIHMNDARADGIRPAAQTAVKEGDPSTVLRRLYQISPGARGVNRSTRIKSLIRLRSMGLSQRKIAMYWLETGLVKHEWGDDPFASALRQVRRLTAELYGPGLKSTSGRDHSK